MLGCVGILVLWFLLALGVRWALFKFPLLAFDVGFWIGLVLSFLVVAAAGWRFVWRSDPVGHRLKYSLLFGFVGAAAVGTGGYHTLNAVLDPGIASPRAYVVEERNCDRARRRRGRRNAWILLRPLAASDGQGLKLDVPTRVCRDMWPNARVVVEIKPGFFGSPWVAGYTVWRER